MNKFCISLCLTLILCGSLMAMNQDLQVLGNQLVEAAGDGNNETIEALLMKDIPVDARNNAESTPLMQAAVRGRKDACEILLNHKAQVNAKDNHGFNPLLSATMNGHKNICELLLTHKAHVNAKNNFGFTPLMLASANTHVAVCVLLLTNNAHVDAKDEEGNTPLMLATRWDRKDVCELLLTHGAQIDARNNAGYTPLMSAAMNGHKDTCKWLIDAMSRKQHEFTKNRQVIISFLGMRKKNGCLKLIGHDMVLCIARMVFDMAKKDNVHVVEQINANDNDALKTELLNYYQTQLSILQGTQSKGCHE